MVNNGKITIVDDDRKTANVECDAGYSLDDERMRSSICINGQWDSTEPHCVRACPLPNELSFSPVECYNQRNEIISCEQWMRHGSQVVTECRDAYEGRDIQEHKCQFGMWSPEPVRCRRIKSENRNNTMQQ